MFCSKCGSQVPDGSKFCPGCGVRVGTQAGPAPAPQPTAPTYQASPAQPSPYAPQSGTGGPGSGRPRRSKRPIIIGAALAVVAVAAIAAFALTPHAGGEASSGGAASTGDSAQAATTEESGTPWSSIDLSGGGYTHEFCISLDGPGKTLGNIGITDQDNTVLGNATGNTPSDDEELLFFDENTINWGSWGPDAFRNARSSAIKDCTLVVPSNATVENPWGRWSFVATCDTMEANGRSVFTRSTTLELNKDGTGTYEFAAMWGDHVSDEVADPTDPNYNPSAADTNFSHSFTWERSGNTFDITFDNGKTYTLTVQ